MPIKIICDGKIKTAKIIDVASGVELDNCTYANIILNPERLTAEATLHFTDVALDVVAEVVETEPPTGLSQKKT